MSEANDELISAYVDGRLSAGEQAAFDGRLQGDAPLRQHIQVTRLLTHTASQLTPVALPRSFVLPDSMALPEKSARASWDWRVLFRLGSALAAVLFVLLVGLDLSQVAGPRVVALTPSALSTLASGASSAKNATVLPFSTQATQATQVQNTASALSAQTFTPRAVIVNTIVANEVEVAPALSSAAAANMPLLTATPAPSPIMTRAPTNAPLTPVPTLASVVAMPEGNTAWPLTRVFAGVALIIGAGLAVLGWRR